MSVCYDYFMDDKRKIMCRLLSLWIQFAIFTSDISGRAVKN